MSTPDEAPTRSSGRQDSPRRPHGRLAAALGIVAVALLAVLVAGGRGGAAGLPGAPVVAVEPGWSVVVEDSPAIMARLAGRATTEPTLDIVGETLLHTVRSRTGQVTALVGRDTDDGAVSWRREIPPGTQPVAVSSGRVVTGSAGRWLSATSGSRSLVGVSMADGAALWTQPIGRDFLGWIDPDGDLFVSGNGQCGYLDPPSGRFRFVRYARQCVPASGGLAQDSPDGWLVLDPSGRPMAVVEDDAGVPRLVEDRVVSVRRTVDVLAPDGRWQQVPGLPRLDRLGDVVLDGRLLAGWAGSEQYVVDVLSAEAAGPYSPVAIPVVVDDELLVVDDGTYPPDELVLDGTWSRSPDANLVRVLDAAGNVLAHRELVLARPLLPTADGVLLWEQVGTDSTLGLYGYDDLDPVWQVSFRGSPLAGLASSDALVVASYLDHEGAVRVVGLRPG